MNMDKHQLTAAILRELHRTGHGYRIDLGPMDAASLRELLRALRDLEHDKLMAVRRARMTPWRGAR